ncbi:MAG: UDP-glucose 4-epimerase GalE [Propionibacterium sp.]|nr:UDP-glucose 4-epimerase GalE [Propionibacterium sp.]
MTWLVTGGAGYIGSHVVRAFLGAGMDCVVIDDLSSGHRAFVPASVPLIVGSVVDPAAVDEALGGHAVSGVVHLAGFKYAGVSMARPRHTYTQNVTGMLTLLDGMARHGVDEMVFSSSAAVYGTPQTDLVTESSPTRPESPYGESKLIGEWLLADEGRAANLRHTSLRYFNVVGSGAPELYDTSPHNLLPIVFDQLLAGRTPSINGDDYATPDGTCVRDYVHVADLAISHVAAAQALDAGRELAPVYNLGSGSGLSVREIMSAVVRVTGIGFTPAVGPRRPGDPAIIVADGRLAARDLDWRMRHGVDDMVRSAWRARTER